MTDFLEQSRAYAALGMMKEAGEAAIQAVRVADNGEAILPWLVRLCYKTGDFRQVCDLGCKLVAFGKSADFVREYTALALHNLGESKWAAELMLALDDSLRTSSENYNLACFLAAGGECDEAVRHLLAGLRDDPDDGPKTWLDGDLKMLWAELARGEFSLETAHLLFKSKFDFLRQWQPEPSMNWVLDAANFRDLPEDVRAVTCFSPREEGYVIDHAKAPPRSDLAVRFSEWIWAEVETNHAHFDKAQRIAWQKVLDAQPGYALAAWKRGDLCAVRHHVVWTIMGAPERISAFFHIEEISPFVQEMRAMLESDGEFFEKVLRAHVLHASDPDEGINVLNLLPSTWRNHPTIEHIYGLCLEKQGRPKEAFACYVRACESAPDDAAFFIAATGVALRQGWKEAAAAIHEAAPAVAHSYKDWLEADAQMKGEKFARVNTEIFCGQPDLGGQIISTKMAEPPAVPCPAPSADHTEHAHE